MKITKRNGNCVEFNENKIINALHKAFNACNYEVDKDVVTDILNSLNIWENINVEEIQDQIETLLMDNNFSDVAKEYILYRHKRSVIRNQESKLIKGISEKLEAKSVQNQNANVDEYSFGGRIGEASRFVNKEYALTYCMSEMSKNNHLNNEIYIHDLDSYAVGMHNCLSIPIDDLLAKGFTTRQADIRPASTVNTAMQLCAVIMQLQSLCQFGGVSYTHLDWSLVPYVRKSFYKHFKDGIKWVESKYLEICTENVENVSVYSDYYTKYPKAYAYAIDMTRKEINQGAEALYHNLGTLQSRSGDQLPFSSINYGTCTLIEGRWVIEALLNASIDGIGQFHKTPIFPCSIFQLKKGVNRHPGDPNYDLFKLALKSTAQRLYPNYANVDWSGNKGYDVDNPCTYFSTMGCRTANGWDINGLAQQKDGRGNICPVTIILPTLAMEADRDEYKFMELLDKKIHEAKDMLIERFNWICKQSPKSAKFMWENRTMTGYDGKNISSALKHGTLAIGQLGLAETLQLLIGCDHTEEKGMSLAKKIESLFKQRCAEFKEQYKLNFGVYFTPAENLCHTALQKFKQKYGIIPNVSDKEFFTNSMHVPVWKNISVKKKIDIESQLTGYSSAGCITYIELPETAKNNIEALEEIVNYSMDKDIPYFAINLPNDVCDDCGYQDEINDKCPQCKSSNIKRLRRVTGYLTGDYKSAFNLGKIQETEMRVKHENS